MKNYNQYSVEDFVLDDEFRVWVLNKNHQDLIWRSRVISHPGMKPVAEEARHIIPGLKDQPVPVSQEEIEEAFHQVVAFFEKSRNPRKSWRRGTA